MNDKSSEHWHSCQTLQLCDKRLVCQATHKVSWWSCTDSITFCFPSFIATASFATCTTVTYRNESICFLVTTVANCTVSEWLKERQTITDQQTGKQILGSSIISESDHQLRVILRPSARLLLKIKIRCTTATSTCSWTCRTIEQRYNNNKETYLMRFCSCAGSSYSSSSSSAAPMFSR